MEILALLVDNLICQIKQEWQHFKESICHLQNIAICDQEKHDHQESVTTGQTHRQTDTRQSDSFALLCFAGDTKSAKFSQGQSMTNRVMDAQTDLHSYRTRAVYMYYIASAIHCTGIMISHLTELPGKANYILYISKI